MSGPELLVEVENLRVDYWSGERWSTVINDISLELTKGDILGIAGESGSGKSTLAYALLGYSRPGGRVSGGSIRFRGRDILSLPKRKLRTMRGREISFVPQNPTMSLSPSMKIGPQIAEVLHFHRVTPPGGITARVRELLEAVGLPDADNVVRKFPYELSGGQQQRVCIAIAIACNPSLVVLDEPTTGLDVTTQARILRLLLQLRETVGSAFVYVSHDLGALSSVCDRIGIIYAGEMVEMAPTARLFAHPVHPYTQGLIASVPRIAAPPDRRHALKGVLRRDQLGEGCRFATRCRYVEPECSESFQRLQTVDANHRVACRRWTENVGRGLAGRGAS